MGHLLLDKLLETKTFNLYIYTGLVSIDTNPQVVTRFYLSPHSPPNFNSVIMILFEQVIENIYTRKLKG